MLRLVDVSRYQVEIPNPLNLAQARGAGYQIANVALSGGQGYVPGSWAETYMATARTYGMGVSTYHWIDGRTSGAAQAATNLSRLRRTFGTSLLGFAHVVDMEETGAKGITPPTWAHVRDYVNAIQDALGRHMMIYSGDWRWPANWPGATLTPWLMGAPNDPVPAEPAASSVAWHAGWGGWDSFAVLQWAVRPLPGTGNCSLSLIRDHGVWADLTGGDVLMPAADPGNAQPEAWAGRPVSPATVDELVNLSATIETNIRAALPETQSSDATADLTKWLIREGHPIQDIGTAAGLLPVIPRGAGETCAPTIGAEQNDWISLGGSNLGCVGDKNHGTGFHRGANFVPATDYSRKRDPNGADGPFVDWNYACAGDFRHGGNAELRDLGRIVLAQLMAGLWTNIGEFIGQPWADRPVMYWNRWTGVLSEYTGSGHDVWFHISWYRSRVNTNTHIWKSAVAIRDGALMDEKSIAAAVWGYPMNSPWLGVEDNRTTGNWLKFADACRRDVQALGTSLTAAIQAIAAKDFVDEQALAGHLVPGIVSGLMSQLPAGTDVSQEELTQALMEAIRRTFAGGGTA